MLCIEDLKDKPSETIIKELNDKLVTRTNKIANLEDQVRRGSALVH